jgi:hypothetical protein
LVPRKFAEQRQVQGSNAQVAFGENLYPPQDGSATLFPLAKPDGGQGTARLTARGLRIFIIAHL